ncbi:hypothetical protein GE118_00760 [Mycoplasma sp. NEAQ87857]|uniref:hypothetical protein n=1 Tax=Mycoplasma sp. NEAQ87857 TaxID=2683967 RepID=UPI00131820F9|nr:hypothetical protein [Mycoplasma sp. NEAQ87857]QGZ97332.1 hypothetical protein GE118_00760 [Mycoplasma sp. NEAQ87857]
MKFNKFKLFLFSNLALTPIMLSSCSIQTYKEQYNQKVNQLNNLIIELNNYPKETKGYYVYLIKALEQYQFVIKQIDIQVDKDHNLSGQNTYLPLTTAIEGRISAARVLMQAIKQNPLLYKSNNALEIYSYIQDSDEILNNSNYLELGNKIQALVDLKEQLFTKLNTNQQQEYQDYLNYLIKIYQQVKQSYYIKFQFNLIYSTETYDLILDHLNTTIDTVNQFLDNKISKINFNFPNDLKIKIDQEYNNYINN